ncbi:tyrosine-type recombinase/integrase [Streptomyces jumonjinensis]|uniref:tyrosine-type recombinase/integrase n=1 Tax=Streptomyces jumonjinensis TaxID=1945 RepID=UPI0037A9E88E
MTYLKCLRIHDLRHSHTAWLIAGKVPLPAIQARLGHESITTTIDVYGHLLDVLDDEVVAAVEWAMDPMAPLPGFLLHSGLAQVPHQRGAFPAGAWTDVEDPGGPGDKTVPSEVAAVFVVTVAAREVFFARRQHAQDVAKQWNDDRAETITKLIEAGWTEDEGNRVRAVGPEERERPAGGGDAWTRRPARQFVHHQVASFHPDGTLAYEPEPLSSLWVWEFETDFYTAKAAQMRTEFRPGPDARTEAYARGDQQGGRLPDIRGGAHAGAGGARADPVSRPAAQYRLIGSRSCGWHMRCLDTVRRINTETGRTIQQAVDAAWAAVAAGAARCQTPDSRSASPGDYCGQVSGEKSVRPTVTVCLDLTTCGMLSRKKLAQKDCYADRQSRRDFVWIHQVLHGGNLGRFFTGKQRRVNASALKAP